MINEGANYNLENFLRLDNDQELVISENINLTPIFPGALLINLENENLFALEELVFIKSEDSNFIIPREIEGRYVARGKNLTDLPKKIFEFKNWSFYASAEVRKRIKEKDNISISDQLEDEQFFIDISKNIFAVALDDKEDFVDTDRLKSILDKFAGNDEHYTSEELFIKFLRTLKQNVYFTIKK